MSRAKSETTDDRAFSKIANGLMKAVSTPTDQLAAAKGEDNLLVRIKRNSDRLESCDRHEFDPQPDWRAKDPLTRQKIRCNRCEGEMDTGTAMTYLRGFAHGSGQDFGALANTVWPPGDAA